MSAYYASTDTHEYRFNTEEDRDNWCRVFPHIRKMEDPPEDIGGFRPSEGVICEMYIREKDLAPVSLRWDHINFAPKNGTYFIGLMKDGTVYRCKARQYHTFMSSAEKAELGCRGFHPTRMRTGWQAEDSEEVWECHPIAFLGMPTLCETCQGAGLVSGYSTDGSNNDNPCPDCNQ